MTFGFERPTIGFLHEKQTGNYFGRLDSDGNVYSWCDTDYTEMKVGTATRDGRLLDLDVDSPAAI